MVQIPDGVNQIFVREAGPHYARRVDMAPAENPYNSFATFASVAEADSFLRERGFREVEDSTTGRSWYERS